MSVHNGEEHQDTDTHAAADKTGVPAAAKPGHVRNTTLVTFNLAVYLVFSVFAVAFIVSAGCRVPTFALVPIFSVYALSGMTILLIHAIYVKYADLKEDKVAKDKKKKDKEEREKQKYTENYHNQAHGQT